MRCLKLLSLVIILFSIVGCTSNKKDPAELYKDYSAEQLYQSGKESLIKREYTASIRFFEALDSLYPFSPYAEPADLDLIYAYYENEDYAGSIAASNRFMRLYPRNQYVDYAYYMKGMSDLNQGKLSSIQRFILNDSASRDLCDVRQAFFDFRDLVELFPRSCYANDSYRRMIYLRNLLAQYEIDTAEYYFQRGAYVASSNRASYVIEHYPYTPQVKRALEILCQSNSAMGLKEPAEDASRVLQANYS